MKSLRVTGYTTISSFLSPCAGNVKGARNMRGRSSEPLSNSSLSHAEIWRLAIPLIDAHGEDAAIKAAELSDESFNAGDLESWHLWLQVMTAVEEFQNEIPFGSVH